MTKYGQCIRFHETDVRSTGRTSMGVIGMSLADGDEVVGMQMESQGEALMIVSEKGLGKCTLASEFNQDDEMMLITTEGIIIRIKVSDTSLLGRVTSGVKLMNLSDDVVVASIAKVREDKSLMENTDASELVTAEEEARSAAAAAEAAKKAAAEVTETDDELMKELLNRAEADAEDEE